MYDVSAQLIEVTHRRAVLLNELSLAHMSAALKHRSTASRQLKSELAQLQTRSTSTTSSMVLM